MEENVAEPTVQTPAVEENAVQAPAVEAAVAQEPVVESTEEVEEEDTTPYDPNVDDYVEGLEEASQPFDSIETFKVDENMPPELKAQLERFNRQTENLNAIMNTDISGDEPVPDVEDGVESSEDDEEDTEEVSNFEIKEDESVEFGNLF